MEEEIMRLITLLPMLIMVLVGSVFADQVVLDAVGDAYVWEAQPDTNYGGIATLYVGDDSNHDLLKSLLKFDISSIPNGATVDFGYLNLWCNIRHGAPTNDMYCDGPTDFWDEMTVTWNNAPVGYGDWVTAPWPTSGSYISFEITDWVQYWIDGDRANRGLLVTGLAQPGYSYCNFDSRESSDPDEHPKLHVIYTPSAVEGTSLGEIKAVFK